MAPRTTGELAGGMAHSDHICCKNYKFMCIKGPAHAPTRCYDQSLYHGDLGRVARSGDPLRTAFGGCILEFTYLEGSVPSLVASRGQASRLGNQRSMAS